MTAHPRLFPPCDFRRHPVGPSELSKPVPELPFSIDDHLLRSPHLSPLRWPGSKRRLVGAITQLIAANLEEPPALFVEPFAGGASVSLRLFLDGRVERAWINDADPLVYAFWRTAAFDTCWLIDAMEQEPITVERWEHHRASNPTSLRDRALKCLFLNRTTFSGILHRGAGPIGGKGQTSENKIDCRFNKAELADRLRLVGALATCGRIVEVTGLDYADLLERLRHEVTISAERVVVYLDPPYVEKAATLYASSFDTEAHDRLANVLSSLPWPWILSYDDHADVHERFADAGVTTLRVDHAHTAATGKMRAAKCELLLTSMRETRPQDHLYARTGA